MATFLCYGNFNGKYGDKFSYDILYDILEQNISGNYSIVRFYGYLRSWGYTGSGTTSRCYINGQEIATFTSISKDQYKEMGYLDVVVPHNADGTGSTTVTGLCDTPWTLGDASCSGTLTLPQIPRTSSVGCTDGNIESTVAISINRASDKFTHTLRYDFGNLKNQTIATSVGTSYPWTLPSSFYNQIPNAKSGVGTVYCDTYSGSTLIGTKACNFTSFASEDKCKPDISATIIDSNDITYALTNDRNKFIKGYSNAKITISATAMPVNSGSTITSRKVTCGDGKEGYGTEVILNGVESGNFTISATDSRNYTTSLSKTMEMIPYVKLTLNPTFYRPEPTTGEVKLSYNGNYYAGSFGATNNSLTVKYRYKESTVTSWDGIAYTTVTSTIDSANNRYSNEISLGTGFDYQKSYDFEILAIDKINNVPKTAHIAEGIPMFAMFKDYLEAFGNKLVNSMGDLFVPINYSIYSGEVPIVRYNGNDTIMASSHGPVVLRPNGVNSTTGQAYVNTDGSFITTGSIFSKGMELAPKPIILYNNDDGSSDTITLNDDIKNYKYIEIFYRNENYVFNSVKVVKGRLYASLITHYTVDWGSQIHIADCLIESSTITLQNGRFINCQLSSGSLDYGSQTTIRIIKVIGYK